MMRTPIIVSAVESVGTVQPEPRPVIAIARVDDDANRRRGSVATARQARLRVSYGVAGFFSTSDRNAS